MNIRQHAARIEEGPETLSAGRFARTVQLHEGRRGVFAAHLERVRQQPAPPPVAVEAPQPASHTGFGGSRLHAGTPRPPAEPAEETAAAAPPAPVAAPAAPPPAAAPPSSAAPAPAPTAPVPLREGVNGPIGLFNPAMNAYYAFDPAGFGSFADAVKAANEMLEEDRAAFGDQMAARMLASRGGKAYQYWHAVDPQQTASGAFGSITNPWVTAYNGGLIKDAQKDLVSGFLQWSDVPTAMQERIYNGLRLQLASTGLYTGRVMPTDVAVIIGNLRAIQEAQTTQAA